MIGQKILQKRIESLIETNSFPQFSIFVGPRGSGKKLFVRWLTKQLSGSCLTYECNVEGVRNAVADAHKFQGVRAIYLFADADKMSVAAKNALLKVTEEPPKNAYFIMTLEDENNTLATIRSRGTIFRMEPYTPKELEEYAESAEVSISDKEFEILKNLCETPGDVDILIKSNISEFFNYVKKVVDNIAEVSIANSFKIADNVDIKGDGNGYDLRLFWNAFRDVLLGILVQSNDHNVATKLSNIISVTGYALADIKIKGINRKMLFDIWLLSVRKELQNVE